MGPPADASKKACSKNGVKAILQAIFTFSILHLLCYCRRRLVTSVESCTTLVRDVSCTRLVQETKQRFTNLPVVYFLELGNYFANSRWVFDLYLNQSQQIQKPAIYIRLKIKCMAVLSSQALCMYF